MEEEIIPYDKLKGNEKKIFDNLYSTIFSEKKNNPEYFYYFILLVAYVNKGKEDEIEKVLEEISKAKPEFIKIFFNYIIGKKSFKIGKVTEIDYRILLTTLKEFVKHVGPIFSDDLDGQDIINDEDVLKILDLFVRSNESNQIFKDFLEDYKNKKDKPNTIEIKGDEQIEPDLSHELQTTETLCTNTKQKEIKDNSEELAKLKELEERNKELKEQLAKAGTEKFNEKKEKEKLNKELLEKEEELKKQRKEFEKQIKEIEKQLEEKDETIKGHVKTINDEKIKNKESVKEREEYRKKIEEKEGIIKEKEDTIKEKEKNIDQLELDKKEKDKKLEDVEMEIKQKDREIEISKKRIEQNEKNIAEQNKLFDDLDSRQIIVENALKVAQKQEENLKNTALNLLNERNAMIKFFQEQNAQQLKYIQQMSFQQQQQNILDKENAMEAVLKITSGQIQNIQALDANKLIILRAFPDINSWPQQFRIGLDNLYNSLRRPQIVVGQQPVQYNPQPTQIYRLPEPQTREEILPLSQLLKSQEYETQKEPNVKVTEVDENKEELEKEKKEEEWVPTQRMDDPVVDKKVDSKVIKKPKQKVEIKKPKIKDTKIPSSAKVKKLDFVKKLSKPEEVPKKQVGETKDDPIIVKESQIIAKKEVDEQPIKKFESTAKYPAESQPKLNDLEQIKKKYEQIGKDELIKVQKEVKEMKEQEELDDEYVMVKYNKDEKGLDIVKFSYYPEHPMDVKFRNIYKNFEEIFKDPDFIFIKDNIKEFKDIYSREERNARKVRRKWIFTELINYVFNNYKLNGSFFIVDPLSLPHDLFWILINYRKEIYDLKQKVLGHETLIDKMSNLVYDPYPEEEIYLLPEEILDSSILKMINDPSFKLIIEKSKVFEENVKLHNIFNVQFSKKYLSKDVWLFKNIILIIGTYFINKLGINEIIRNPPYKMLPFLLIVQKYRAGVFSVLNESEVKDKENVKKILTDITINGQINVIIEKAKKIYDSEYQPNKEILRDKIFMDLENATEEEVVEYTLSGDPELNFIEFGDQFIEEYLNYRTEGSNLRIGIWMFDQILKFLRENARDIINNHEKFKQPKYLLIIRISYMFSDFIFDKLFRNEISLSVVEKFINVLDEEQLNQKGVFEYIMEDLEEYKGKYFIELRKKKKEEKKKLNKKE